MPNLLVRTVGRFSRLLTSRSILLVSLLSPAFSSYCSAATEHVYPGGKIQDAIDGAANGDEIIVHPGTYKENIQFKSKNITLRSTAPTSPAVVAATIIDGQQKAAVVTFTGFETVACTLRGFTITNGKGGIDGGVWSHATIQNNRITSNSTTGWGGIRQCDGAIFDNVISNNRALNAGMGGGVEFCGGTIAFNLITSNSAQTGGGMHFCHGTIQGNVISNNAARINGGGLSHCQATIMNNVIVGNRAPQGGGGVFFCQQLIQNNVIAYNQSGQDGGAMDSCSGATIRNNTIYGNAALRTGGGISWSTGTLINNILWKNTAPTGAQLSASGIPRYCCIEGWPGGGVGNLNAPPLLVNPPKGDWHLQPGSPCVDAGARANGLNSDYEGQYRPFKGARQVRGDGSLYDIGADEYTGRFATAQRWKFYR